MTTQVTPRVKKTRANRVGGDSNSMKVFSSNTKRLVHKTTQLELAELKEKGIIQQMLAFDFCLSGTLNKVSDDENFIDLFDKFKYYKENSEPHEIATPSRKIQEETESLIAEFGRDRFFKHPNDARKDDLTHLHLFTDDCEWLDADGTPKVQWECTSNSYLIYSYFEHESVHVFYLIALIDKGAHQATKNLPDGDPNPIVLEWLAEAIRFRTNYPEYTKLNKGA